VRSNGTGYDCDSFYRLTPGTAALSFRAYYVMILANQGIALRRADGRNRGPSVDFFHVGDYLNRRGKTLRKRFLFLLEFAPNELDGWIQGHCHWKSSWSG
jgi:hypothetical protein